MGKGFGRARRAVFGGLSLAVFEFFAGSAGRDGSRGNGGVFAGFYCGRHSDL